MRIALVVLPLTADVAANQATMARYAHAAADSGADLVLFPEAALTGLVNNDDPAHDLPLGQPIPGAATEALAGLARERALWLASGLLEREGEQLYDSAVLLSPRGEIGLHYRRIDPGWHGPHADPAVYRQGMDLPVAETPLGRCALLLCGDLFRPDLVARARALAPDLLLFPVARSFEDGSHSQERWDAEVEPEYGGQVRRVGVTTLLANYLDQGLADDHSFGGAAAFAGDGTVLAKWPVGREGMLLVDLGER
jgi:N-carbamoylputrescine amidase